MTAIGYVSDWRARGTSLQGTGGFAYWDVEQDGGGWAIWPVLAFSVVLVSALWAARSVTAATAILVGGVAVMVLVGIQLALALAPSGAAASGEVPALQPSLVLLGVGLGLIVAGGVRTTVRSFLRLQEMYN